jgi:hypothetical protein
MPKNFINTFLLASFSSIASFYNSIFKFNQALLSKKMILKLNKKIYFKKCTFIRMNLSYYTYLKHWFKSFNENFSKRFNIRISINNFHNSKNNNNNNNNNNKSNNNQNKKQSFYFASLSSLGIFTWDKYKINDEEVNMEVIDIFSFFHDKKQQSQDNKKDLQVNNVVGSKWLISLDQMRGREDEEWKIIFDKPDIIIWRRSISLTEETDKEDKDSKEDYDLFEYRVLGKIDDINAIEFFQTQIDLKYRQEW